MSGRIGIHWFGCYKVHPECFWQKCIHEGQRKKTTAEYQAFLLFSEQLCLKLLYKKQKESDNNRQYAGRKEVIKDERRSARRVAG